jgi:peptidyl-tRNA hydrolase
MKGLIDSSVNLTNGGCCSSFTCSHATLGLFEELLEAHQDALVARWQDQGQAKVALKVEDEDHMLDLERQVSAL